MPMGIALVCGLALVAWWSAVRFQMRRQASRALDVQRRLICIASPDQGHYDPQMVSALPEVARRYFGHAIAPGTAVAGSVSLTMSGSFFPVQGVEFGFLASQSLRPPGDFVWVARMRKGIVTIDGSDAFFDGVGWTRFWLMGLLPLVNMADTPDFKRSAASRPAVESIWVPSSLLPQRGVRWRQTGANSARVTLPTLPIALDFDLTVDADGAVRRVETMRWSNANPDKAYRLQPFWAEVFAEAAFGGYTIPSLLEVGNGLGRDKAEFFRARIEDAAYGP